MLRILADNVWATVQESTPEEVEMLSLCLQARDEKMEDGEMPPSLFDSRRQRFPSGLLRRVIRDLPSMSVQIDVTGSSDHGIVVNDVNDEILNGITLRKFQKMAADVACFLERGVISVPTAGGKTFIAAAILQNLGLPSVFLVPTLPLLDQIVEKFKKYGIQTGKIGGGEFSPDKHTVAFLPWLASLLKSNDRRTRDFLSTRKVMLIDEAHHAGALSWLAVTMNCSANWRIGFSGTPHESRSGESWRDLLLEGVCGPIIFSIPPKYLVEEGFIAKPKIIFLPIGDRSLNSKFHVSPADTKWRKGQIYNKVYKEGVVNHEERNRLTLMAVRICLFRNIRPLILVQRIEHGRNLLSKFDEMGIESRFLMGSGKVCSVDTMGMISEKLDQPGEKHPSRTVENFLADTFSVLIASPVLGEGYDLPDSAVQALFVLTAGRNRKSVLQRLGRALRPRPGRNEVWVFDFDDKHHFFLHAQSKVRRSIYVTEGYEIVNPSEWISEMKGSNGK